MIDHQLKKKSKQMAEAYNMTGDQIIRQAIEIFEASHPEDKSVGS